MQNEKELKKEYVAPKMSIVEFEQETNLLQGSPKVKPWDGEGG